jgi:tRNA wybutosine-synthesizing protein 2
MRFRDELRLKMAEIPTFTKDLVNLLPSGYFELSGKVILKLKPSLEPFKILIAEKVAEILPRSKAIWLRKGQIKGKYREPSGLEHLWGDSDTEVRVKENNVYYYFDFTQIMFAKGNVHERGLLPKKVKEGELIVDMFAGIGYFSLGMAKTGKPTKIYSIEWNPTAFKYLQKNIEKNHVDHIITPIHGNCKEIVVELAQKGIIADRVVMGLLPAPKDAIEPALTLTSPKGTIFIYEGVEPEDSTSLFDEFTLIATKNNFRTELLERRIVKAFKPHEYHVVIEVLVSPQRN